MSRVISAYEAKRLAQIARNKILLQEAGILRPIAPPTELGLVLRKPVTPRKRKVHVPFDDSPGSDGRRTSSRVKTRIARFEAGEDARDDSELVLYELNSDEEDGEGAGSRRNSLSGFRPDPKVFGHQPGTAVGKTWELRMGASQAGIHAPVVAGISGSATLGAWSVALSGGYEDDIDVGYAFTFTGSGGRDLKGTASAPKNLRTAPQSSDQTFDNAVNAALRTSVETKKPIRVIRGYKGQSCFSPETGYRYDGLYTVIRSWQDIGEAGFQVCRFAFVRMDGQPDLPVQEGREEEAANIIAEYGKGTRETPASPVKNSKS